jgi:mannose-6-phosphate isomerase-like protein (cupin superfamily)
LNDAVDEPVLLAPGEGDVVGDTPERFVAVKAGLEPVAIVEFRYGSGRSGPERHVHRRHADGFRVLEGELLLEIGPDAEPILLHAGDFALVPPGLVHTFRNDSSADAWFINLHAPSCGFHEYLRGDRDEDDFDQYEPPDDGGLPADALVLRREGAGEDLRMGPSVATIKTDVNVGGGQLALMDDVLAPGFPGPVPHRHREMVDSFWVLEGELTVRLGEREATAGPGTLAVVPPGNVHTFANRGDAPVRVLNLMFPAGLEQYLKRVAAESAGGPPDPARMAAIAADYDFEPAG